jgi:membrane-bound serine protease (ClpP class)
MDPVKRYLSLTLALGAVLAAAPVRGGEGDVVYVLPVKGMIERGLLYAFRRGMEEARDAHAAAVILDMETPGGKLQSAEEIVLMLLDAPMPTYTFVNPRAISAGAIIALATDKIYMTPTGLIGDAMPIMMSPLPFGGAQAVPEDLKEKVMSPTIALVRSAAQAKGHDPQIGEAMVRPEFEYKIGDEVVCPAGQLLTLTAEDAAKPLREGGAPLLSSGTVATLDGLLEAIGLAGSRVVTVNIKTSERIARVIEGFPVSGILLALGLLGLYIEFKTPGFGVPGIAGMACLALWFWGHHIAGLSGMLELLLFTIGVILLLAEIFVIPGFGATGISGIALIFTAILLSTVRAYPHAPPELPPVSFPNLMWRDGVYNVGIAMVIVFVAGVILARYLPESNLFHRIRLDTAVSKQAGYQASDERSELVGRDGIAFTALRPAGTGDFYGRRVSVVTNGAYIDKGAAIVVAEVRGNRIVVVPAPAREARPA